MGGPENLNKHNGDVANEVEDIIEEQINSKVESDVGEDAEGKENSIITS